MTEEEKEIAWRIFNSTAQVGTAHKKQFFDALGSVQEWEPTMWNLTRDGGVVGGIAYPTRQMILEMGLRQMYVRKN